MNPLQLSIEQIFAASLLSGFLYSLMVYISGGRFRFLRRFRLIRTRSRLFSSPIKFGRKKILRGKDFTPPWVFPILSGTFLTGFGLTGLILQVLIGMTPKDSLIGALITGVSFSIIMLLIAKRFLSDSGAELKGSALYGTVGYVSLTIPESGMGSIAYVADGKRVVMPARSRSGDSISKGSQVVIVDLQARVALVEEY